MVKSKRVRVWLTAGLLSVGMANGLLPLATHAQQGNPAAELARVEDIKSEAFRALRAGEFDKTSQLLHQAQQLTGDPTLSRMKSWLTDYQTRVAAGMAERQKQYDDAVADVKKLQEAGYETYAGDAVANAYYHAPDKEAFRKDPWVREVLTRTVELAAVSEREGDWLTARRLYSDLTAVEPLNATWRAKINEVARRLGLLAMYAPDTLEEMYKGQTEVSRKVAALIEPDKKPTTRPTDEALNDEFKIDWRQMLAGVKVDMLREALEDARESYYRDTSYPELVTGGVTGLSQFITTTGLDRTFPKLADEAARKAFADALDDLKSEANAEGGIKDRRLVAATLSRVLQANRDTVGLPDEVVIYEFANGATSVLDPFTNVIWPYDLSEFQKSTQGEFVGVGIHIKNDEDGYLQVVSPLPDSPAYKAGIHADDRIVQINGKNAKGVTTMQAVKAITGPAGSSVTLTIESPDGKTKNYVLERSVIKVASVKGWTQKPGGSWQWLVDQDNGIGYVRLTNFTKDSSKEIRDAIEQIRAGNGKAIILDLRHNPGGLLTAATEIADKFLERGNIVSTRSAKNVQTAPPVNARSSSDDTKLPTIVLVNQFSASASEIVSGALKDHQRALIVGERTFGKGSVQMLFPLENRSAFLKLTTSHYYLPSGRCLHREEDSTDWGVDPDLAIDMTPEQMRNVNRMRQELDVIRDPSLPATNPTTVPAEFKSREDYLLASDPQLGAAVLLLRMQLLGAPLM